MNIRNITLEWSYPKRLENIFDDERVYDKGIYCIYRRFGGNDTLIYIGKTKDSFFNRLSCHCENWINKYRGEKFVRLGVIVSPQVYDDQIIEDVESALIYEMQPLHNTDKCKTYHYTYECKVKNTRYRGHLPEEVSMREQE